jgi:DNA-binding transcriptional MerR regulator
MPLKEKTVSKIYYSIGEVAMLSGKKINPSDGWIATPVAPSAIRFWQELFDIQVKKVNSAGKRYFNREEVRDIFAIVYLLRIEEYTASGAIRKFKLWKSGNFEIPEQYLRLD